MEIYFVNCDLSGYKKTEKTKFHHRNSHIFLKGILKIYHNIDDEIKIDNKKPYIENNPVYFSISHSNNLFCYAISKNPIGIDIELNKERNFKNILKYMNFACPDNLTKEEFYQIWTSYEANYKLGHKICKNYTFKYKDYFGSASFLKEEDISFFEITYSDINSIDNKNKFHTEYKSFILPSRK